MNNKGNEKKIEGKEKKERYIQIMKDYRSGDEFLKKRATEMMVSDLSNYIYSVIRTHFPTYLQYTEDLFQEGVLAVLNKMDLYDPELGTPVTFFHIWIKSEMNSFIIGNINHTTNHYGHNINKIIKAINDFDKANMSYNNNDIAKHINIPLETVIACRKIMNNSQEVSLDADGGVMSQQIVCNQPTPEEKLIDKEKNSLLYKAISELEETKKFIVVHKLDLTGSKKSYKVIAKELGISIDKTRKLYQEALREIKNKIVIKKYFGTDFLTKEEKLLKEAEVSLSEAEISQEDLEELEEIDLDIIDFI